MCFRLLFVDLGITHNKIIHLKFPHIKVWNPRIIDNIMTSALTLGAQLKKVSIDADVIMGAINELGFSQ